MGAEGALLHSTLLDTARRHFASYSLNNMPGEEKKKRNLKIQIENWFK